MVIRNILKSHHAQDVSQKWVAKLESIENSSKKLSFDAMAIPQNVKKKINQKIDFRIKTKKSNEVRPECEIAMAKY